MRSSVIVAMTMFSCITTALNYTTPAEAFVVGSRSSLVTVTEPPWTTLPATRRFDLTHAKKEKGMSSCARRWAKEREDD